VQVSQIFIESLHSFFNLSIYTCSIQILPDERSAFAYLIEDYEFLPGMLKVGYAGQSPCS